MTADVGGGARPAGLVHGHLGRRLPRVGIRPARSVRDRGSATVLMLGVVCMLTTLTLSGIALSGAVLASHRARAAVDLAALAGAEVLLRGGAPAAACAAATGTATTNGARTTGCFLVGPTVLVHVSVPVGVRGLGAASASARAGPSATGASP